MSVLTPKTKVVLEVLLKRMEGDFYTFGTTTVVHRIQIHWKDAGVKRYRNRIQTNR